MISIYEYRRPDSRFVWFKFWEPREGAWKRQSTGIADNDRDAARRLAKARNALELRLINAGAAGPDKGPRKVGGWGWVTAYLRERHAHSRSTLEMYLNQWTALWAYLRDRSIVAPAELTREGVLAYVPWRTSRRKGKSGKMISRNTAIGELKLMGRLLDEALARKMVEANPARKLGLKRAEPAIKPELSHEDVHEILDQLADDGTGGRMHDAFLIALHTGLRHAETRIALRDIDLERGSIFIRDPKGGPRRAFTIPLPHALRELFERMKREKRTHTWELKRGKGRVPHGIEWRRFFDGLGMAQVCFHCTRVTFISRGARAGVPQPVMMRLVNHASTEVHRVYQRVQPEDLTRWRAHLDGAAEPPHSSPAH